MAELDGQRQSLIDSLAQWLREYVGNERNDVQVQLLNGVEADYRQDLVEPDLGRNGTMTLTIWINGGARHSRVA